MIEIIKEIINEDREFIIKFVIFFSGISFGVSSFVLGEPIMLNYYQQWIVLIVSILVAIYLVVFANIKNK